MEGRGYAGKILYVDLSSGKSWSEPLNNEVAYALIGGKGLGAYLLFRYLKPNTDPLSPDNILIFATGPLTGTIAPTGNRFCVVTKSPLTGTFLDSHCGGSLGISLKKAGYDALVIKGKATAISILVVDGDSVEVAEAENLKGLSTVEVADRLKEKLGEDFSIASIGPAGERRSLIATIQNDLRSAGRGGSGAVMGSKNLKAIAVRGEKAVRVHDPRAFRRAAWYAHRLVKMHEMTARLLPTYGSANILLTVNEVGALPSYYFKSGVFSKAEEVSGESWRSEIWVRDVACMYCPIACSKVTMLDHEEWGRIVVDGPDYETIWAFGPNCGVSDKAAIARANQLCDLYGVDTISAGNVVAYLMRCFEHSLISAEDLEGIELRFGDARSMVRAVEKICKCEGVGEIMARGVRKLAEHLYKVKGDARLLDLALHVKGLELPAYEPRAAYGMALGYATADRGACHLRGYTASQELLGYGGGADPLSPIGKAQLVISRQNEKAVVDSSGICFYAFMAFTLKEIRRMLVAATGLDYRSEHELELAGERIYNLTRLFNVREGFKARDDLLPRKFVEEPLPEGPAKGSTVPLRRMLEEYYTLRGWDENGIPRRSKIVELGLHELLPGVLDISAPG